ncbi:MAG: DUF1631 family protein [Rubrivivax sp.]|nr:DUF1631 family protein [Rubrivivax sp.]
MKPNPVHRLPATLEAAVQRLKLAAREATERTIESLGLAALAATHAFQRDGLLGAQFELNRKSAVFVLTFNDAFDERVVRELGPRIARGATEPSPLPAPAEASATNWDALSLVEDREVEAQISAERFGMEIAHACEWELRELDAYVATVLADAGGERERNPLRPDIVGHAMIRGIEAVSDRADVRKVLSSELSRSLGSLLRGTYGAIVSDFRNAGVQPLGLSVRQRLSGGRDGRDGGHGESLHGDEGPAVNPNDSRHGGRRLGHSGHSGFGPSVRSPYGSGHGSAAGRLHGSSTHGGTLLGQVDPALMSLIRRLAFTEPYRATDSSAGYAELEDNSYSGQAAPFQNLIHAHREELRQASNGSLDHMVIDVIGFLFDQILADPKVPPQMARLIARLQLPVLRAALGDTSFFSSRRHPVRRFVNRIASLGAAFEDYNEEGARNFLTKVKALIQEVVEGDFDQIEVYEAKLVALEAFVAEQAASEVQGQGSVAELLSEKEDEQRLRQLYAQRLAGDLKDVAAPAFVRDFVSRVWSQVMLRATAQGGPEGANSVQAQRLRRAGRELMLSVQPKATPAHRKVFLAELPKLMLDLTEGMNLIGWPDAQRRAFFGQLMPAHAEALKSPAARQLDLNMMARQVEGALERPAPSREEAKASAGLPVLNDEIVAPTLSAEEAQRVGLVDESAVNWNGQIDIDLSAADAVPAHPQPAAPGLPAISDAPETTHGRELAEHVQIGFAYQMHLDDSWQKVRLSHVSPGRSFFIFTHGSKHKKTVSLTQRMLVRLCESGRLRAFENSTLLERATERARRQLATLAAQPARGSRA